MAIRLLGLGARMAILAVFAIFFIAPVLWLILAPTKSDHALITSSPFSFGSFHNVAQAWNHLDAYSDHLYRRWIANTLIYSLSATAITLAISIPAGYGLALGKFPGRKLILTLTLVVMIMPAAALVLPIFLELNALHLIGSVFSVILPFSFFPFGIYLAYIYYATSIPSELLDAARVDGCGEWLTFRRVALPLAKPVVALVFFFSFVANWNNFFLPYVVLADSNQYPITVGLSNLLASTPSFNPAVGGGGQSVNIFKPELALATLLAVIPVAIVFLLSQRALVRGTLGGAVKQ
jgi:multiple sugar transport system permease protein